ncbi:Hypothetical_protein [Hexamita inflata]|uniref:Hypothetical_protein n=1 Tax=Hexamita inflata TaxID=28002 RepID=A0AA86UB50_9EUKA|nr:Hypothetical protein HINF_LOCUS33271 [Hexamita inflata]
MPKFDINQTVTLRVYFQNNCTKCEVKLSDQIDSLKKYMSCWKENPNYSVLYQQARVQPHLRFATVFIISVFTNGQVIDICKKNVTDYWDTIHQTDSQIEDDYTREYSDEIYDTRRDYYAGRCDPGDGDYGEGNVKYDSFGYPYVD